MENEQVAHCRPRARMFADYLEFGRGHSLRPRNRVLGPGARIPLVPDGHASTAVNKLGICFPRSEFEHLRRVL